MKLHKTFAAFMAAIIAFCVSLPAFASSDIPALTTTFTLSDEIYPSVTRGSVNQGGYGSGTQDFVNEPFKKGYEYIHLSSCNNLNGSMIFDLSNEITSLDESDAVYISFWYKSQVTFEKNGTTYTANEKERINHMRHVDGSIGKGMMQRLLGNTGEGGGYDQYGDYMYADNQWHKVELYTPANAFNPTKLFTIAITNTGPVYIKIAGMRVGILDMESYNNDRAYTDIGFHLRRAETTGLILNGKSLALEEGVTEYAVSADNDSLTADVAEGSTTYIAKVEKLGVGKYEISVAARAYHEIGGDNVWVGYRQRYNNGAYGGDIITKNYQNSTLYKKYIINLNLKSAAATSTIAGIAAVPGAALDGCTAGDAVTVNIDYTNQKAENKEFLVLLLIYKNGYIEKVISAKEIIADTVPALSKPYTYILPEGDYTGCTIDYFVLDTNGMAEVSK